MFQSIECREDLIDFSTEALDFMDKLLTVGPAIRLGANGATRVKAHPWFYDLDWDYVTKSEAAFIPQVNDPRSTTYYDLRGGTTQLFHDEEAIPVGNSATTPGLASSITSPPPILGHLGSLHQNHGHNGSPSSDDLGSFSFKNLPENKPMRMLSASSRQTRWCQCIP